MLLCLPSPLLLLAWYFSERPGSWPRAHRFTSQDVPRGEHSFHLLSYSMCPASGPTASADEHWAQAPRRAITDPLRCQADMEQLLAAAGPEQSPPCVRVTANPPRTNTPQLAQLAVPQRRDLLEQLLHLTIRYEQSSPPRVNPRTAQDFPRRSLLSSATSGKSAVNSQDSTSLFELCLQHGAAEKRLRAVKPQTAACKSSASVSTLPDAAVIEFDSRLATRQGLSHSVRLWSCSTSGLVDGARRCTDP